MTASALFLEITDERNNKPRVTVYRVTPHQPDPRVAVKAWRLTAPDGQVYDVAMNSKGWLECDCEDAVFRERRCKHATALIECGLLEAEL